MRPLRGGSTMAKGPNKWPVWLKCGQRGGEWRGVGWAVTIPGMAWKATRKGSILILKRIIYAPL